MQRVTELILQMGNRMMWCLGKLGAQQEHVDRHAGGEVVDDHLEFCKARSQLGSDSHKDIEHATRVND